MITEHQENYLRVLRAWFEGQEIEANYTKSGWITYDSTQLPNYYQDVSYRIKSDILRYKIALYKSYTNGVLTKVPYVVVEAFGWEDTEQAPDFIRWISNILEVDISK